MLSDKSISKFFDIIYDSRNFQMDKWNEGQANFWCPYGNEKELSYPMEKSEFLELRALGKAINEGDIETLCIYFKENVDYKSSFIVNCFNRCAYAAQRNTEVVAKTISNYVNAGNNNDFDELAKLMVQDHRTLQQSKMRLVYAFISEMAQLQYTDARNEASVNFAKRVMELKDVYFPLI